MVSFEEIQAAYYMVAATGALIAAVYYVLNMKATLQTRQTQLFMGIYQQIMSPNFSKAEHILSHLEMKDMNDWDKMRANREQYMALNSYGCVLEGIGVLVKEKLIDIRLPAMLYSSGIIFYWNKFGPVIKEARKRYNTPRMLIEIEDLYVLMFRYAKEHPELKISTETTFTDTARE